MSDLLPGWECPRCRAFNGDAKERLSACRCCAEPRAPQVERCPSIMGETRAGDFTIHAAPQGPKQPLQCVLPKGHASSHRCYALRDDGVLSVEASWPIARPLAVGDEIRHVRSRAVEHVVRIESPDKVWTEDGRGGGPPICGDRWRRDWEHVDGTPIAPLDV